MSIMKKGNGKNNIVMQIVSAAPVFVYFLFFIGRAYSEAYLKILGIPASSVKYELSDYAYFGAQLDTLLITVVFTAIFVCLVWYFRTETDGSNKYKKSELALIISYLPYSVIVLIVSSAIFIFNKSVINQPAAVIMAIMTTIIPAGLIIITLTERDIVKRIKRGRILSPLFVASIAITLIFFPYLSSSGWGAFKAYTSPYKELNLSSNTVVEIYASHPLSSDLKWDTTEDNVYVTTDELFLILENDSNLFIKTSLNTKLKESKTYIISTADIISYSISTKEPETTQTTPPPN
jgi:hypothetical protein